MSSSSSPFGWFVLSLLLLLLAANDVSSSATSNVRKTLLGVNVVDDYRPPSRSSSSSSSLQPQSHDGLKNVKIIDNYVDKPRQARASSTRQARASSTPTTTEARVGFEVEFHSVRLAQPYDPRKPLLTQFYGKQRNGVVFTPDGVFSKGEFLAKTPSIYKGLPLIQLTPDGIVAEPKNMNSGLELVSGPIPVEDTTLIKRTLSTMFFVCNPALYKTRRVPTGDANTMTMTEWIAAYDKVSPAMDDDARRFKMTPYGKGKDVRFGLELTPTVDGGEAAVTYVNLQVSYGIPVASIGVYPIPQDESSDIGAMFAEPRKRQDFYFQRRTADALVRQYLPSADEGTKVLARSAFTMMFWYFRMYFSVAKWSEGPDVKNMFDQLIRASPVQVVREVMTHEQRDQFYRAFAHRAEAFKNDAIRQLVSSNMRDPRIAHAKQEMDKLLLCSDSYDKSAMVVSAVPLQAPEKEGAPWLVVVESRSMQGYVEHLIAPFIDPNSHASTGKFDASKEAAFMESLATLQRIQVPRSKEPEFRPTARDEYKCPTVPRKK